MAEYIEREALGIGKCNPDVFEDKGYAKGWNAAIDIIQSAPAADVVPGSDFRDCRNELCLKCGAYTERHNGACDGCRWRDA